MMLTIKIRNIKTKDNIADYAYTVWVNNECIESWVYKGHDRADGWAKLVHDIAELYLTDNTEEGKCQN